MYKLEWTKQAEKDSWKIEFSNLKKQVAKIQGTVKRDPFEPVCGHNFEKLKGYEPPIYTRRINIRHRFVYTVESNAENHKDPNGIPYEGIVVVHRMWGHFPP